MYQAHFQSAMTVRDRASFPCCSEFGHCHCKKRLLDPVCACGHGLGWYPPACGLRQSSLIHQFAPKRVVHFGGSGCCRSHGHESQFVRLNEDCRERRRVACAVQEEKFGGPCRLDYGVEIHRWVQEALSLLVRFNTGLFPGPGKWGNVRCDESPFFRCDRDLDGESESSFSFKHWVSEEIANVDVGRARKTKSMVGSVNRKAGGRRNRASRGGHRRRDEREDDDAGHEVRARWTDYDSSSSSSSHSSSKRQLNRGRSQVKFAVHDKCFSSRRDQTESRASDRDGVKKDVRNRAFHSGHRRHDKREDDDAGYEVRARWTDYDSSSSSSSKKRQKIGRSQDKFTVHDEHFSSRRDQTESTLRANDRHGVTEDVACEAESSSTTRLVGTQTRIQKQITRDDQYSYDGNRRNKQQETVGGDRSFSKRDEIKVCVGEEENRAALSRTAGRRREQQIQMNQEVSKIDRRNVIRDSSVSGGTYSGGYRHHKSYEDSQVRTGVTRELNQRHDRTAHDDVEYTATDAHYRYKDEQRVLVNERQQTSTSVQHSAQRSKQAQVSQSSRKPAPRHPDSSVTVVDSDLSRLQNSKEYICKHCGSCIVDSSRQANTSSMERDTRISQEQTPSTQVPIASSSQLPPGNYSRTSGGQKTTGYTTSDYVGEHRRSSNMEYTQETITGGTPRGVRIAEPATLQEEQRSQPSEPIPGSSSKFTGAHQSERLATSVFVAKDSQSLSTSSSQEEAILSGQISAQGVSIRPPLSETCGDHHSPGHATNDYVPVLQHSERVDYREEFNTSSQTGAAIRGQVTLQDPSVPSCNKLVLRGSLGTAAADRQPAGYTASEYVGKHRRSSKIEYRQEVVTDGTSTGVRIPEPATLQEEQRSQPSEPRPGSSSKFTGAPQSGRLATNVSVAKDSHPLSTSGSQEEAVLSGRMSSQGVSIRPPPSETYGDHQSPDYAINDHVHHSVDIDYQEEFNTSSLIGAAIRGQVTLQEPSVPSSSKWVLQGSLGTAAADRQPAGYSTNESFTRSSQIDSHVLNAQLQGGALRKQSETGNTRNDDLSEQSGLHTGGSDSSPVFFLGKSSHETKESSVQQLPQAGLPSQRILKTTENICLVERERTSDQTTVVQQVLLANPSSADSVKSDTNEKNSRNYGMQSSWQSPASSEIRGPPDDMWHVAGEIFEGPCGVEMLEATPPPVSVASGENLTEGTVTAGAVAGTGVPSSNTAIVKRPNKSLWGYLAEIVKAGWILRMGSHDSTPKSTAKSSSNESGGTEAWISGHEPEDEEKVRREKKGGSKEPPAVKGSSDEITSELSLKQGQEITEGTNVQATITNDGFAMPPVGLSERGSIRRRASSLSDNQKWDSAANSAYVTSSSASASSRTSPDIITSSIGTTTVHKQRDTSEVRASFVEVPGDFQTGMRELPIKGGPGDAGREDRETTLMQSKLKRTAQVQRERFEAWEEAYRLEGNQRKMDEMFMREALKEARKAADTWEVPVGAVLVQDGKIISRGCNLVEELRDATAHAELICIREASNTLKSWHLAGTTLYVTLEPCAMCAGAILQARIDTLVWGAPNKLLGADGSWVRLFYSPDEGQSSSGQPSSPVGPVHPFHPSMKIRRGILETECSDVMQHFFQLRKKTRLQESPPSCMPLANPPNFFSKMHDFFGMMICL